MVHAIKTPLGNTKEESRKKEGESTQIDSPIVTQMKVHANKQS